MATFFACGAVCFLVGPFPGYAPLVRGVADAVTFFVGSILFTLGGAALVGKGIIGLLRGFARRCRVAPIPSLEGG
jgi:hypothetical protein